MRYIQIAILALLFTQLNSLTLTIQEQRTCIKIQAEFQNDKILINFHQNLNLGSCSLRVYSQNGAILADSGLGHQYQHYLQILLPTKGQYDMCFEKNETNKMQVSFEIMREEQQLSYAGKEDLGRITRRVSDFLVEIKKSSWEYKQLLAQHNKWGQKFRDYENINYTLYGLKLAAMVCVLSVQIWVVKKVFE